MHHAELVKELSKALCQVANVLPQAEHKVLLYPTDEMKTLLASLNARIIKFAQRAASWYKESKAKHLMNAILRPYSLYFQDIVDDVADVSIKIDRLALSMAMTELRATRMELQSIRKTQVLTHDVVIDTRQKVEGTNL